METRLEPHGDDAIQEILRRAMVKDASEGDMLRDRLLATADELGISHEAVLAAEKEYRLESARGKELAAYRAHQRKDFVAHLAIYVAVNIFLIAVNLFTYHEDKSMWAMFPLLGWGIGIVCHAVGAFSKPDWHDEEFQKWREKRQDPPA
jgi:hypothetical protein